MFMYVMYVCMLCIYVYYPSLKSLILNYSFILKKKTTVS